MNQKIKLKGVKEKVKTVTLYEKLKTIFRQHVGKGNSLTAAQLYRKVYGYDQATRSEKYFRWKAVLIALSMLRRKDKMFTVHYWTDKGLHYYVLHNTNELKEYDTYVTNRINGWKRVRVRAQKAVDQKWHQKF